MASFILILAVVGAALPLAKALLLNTIFVVHDKSTCPSRPCYTINELLVQENNINSNTVIKFQAGKHIVNVDEGLLTFQDATHIEFSGFEPKEAISNERIATTIECLQPLGIEISNISYLYIFRIRFINCTGANFNIDASYSILISDCNYISIDTMTITNTGIVITKSSQVSISRLKMEHFQHNTILTRINDVDEAIIQDFESTSNSLQDNLYIFDSVVKIKGYAYMHNNTGGAQLAAMYSIVDFDDNSIVIISNNTNEGKDKSASIVYITHSELKVGKYAIVRIENNTAAYGCGGINAQYSQLIFEQNSTLRFSQNIGQKGGALALYRKSVLQFATDDSSIRFIENRARYKGGAIFIEDSDYIHDGSFLTDGPAVFSIFECINDDFRVKYSQLIFINNRAEYAGDEIYGGWFDWPYRLTNSGLNSDRMPFRQSCDNEMDFSSTEEDGLSIISSNPVRICMCTNSIPDCNITNYEAWLYPGQTLQLEAVAVGQGFGTVPSSVLTEFVNSSIKSSKKLERGQDAQYVDRFCTPVQYTVLSPKKKETIVLYPDYDLASSSLKLDRLKGETLPPMQLRLLYTLKPRYQTLFTDLKITIYLSVCPLGYMRTTNHKCQCHPYLTENNIECNTNDYTVQRPRVKWINATFTHTKNATEYGIIVHHHCPYDYCHSNDTTLSLNHPNEQCDFNRSGILCGECQTNLSQVFGTSRCKRCSSQWVLLIVPTVTLAGIALIVFLMLLDLTVSIGTINGLVFYANIVRANQAIFFPTRQTDTFLNIFIAWLNLDLGTETCFYDGLDAYTETWLQFIFPLYIWLLVTIIIVSSHYSTTVSRWTGTNAVQVLATLFLLSYVKLLRLIITVFLSTDIVYPDGYRRRVWLYDGNVDYLKGKHIPLFIAALLALVILTVPYTTTLLTVQWLQKSNSCIFNWVHKLKPIFDAHTGPYKSRHRYWTGFLLLVRVFLILVFTINIRGDPSINLFTIIVIVLCLSLYFFFVGGPYKSHLINVIEMCFYFNAILISSASLYEISTQSNSPAATITSTSIAFAIFTIIVFYHVLKRITETRRGARLKHSIKERVMVFAKQTAPTFNNMLTDQQATNTQPVPHSSIELKEPLLADITQNTL